MWSNVQQVMKSGLRIEAMASESRCLEVVVPDDGPVLDSLDVEYLGGVQRVGLRAQVDTVQGPTQSDGVTRWDML